MLTSARYLIVYPNPTRVDTADVPRDIGALVVAIEKSAMYGQGTLALRPTSTAGTPGIQGRFYMATDQTPMVLYYDYGTGWASVGSISSGSIGTAQLADDSITGGPAGAGVKIKQLTITHDNIVAGTIRGGSGQEIAAGSVTAISLAAALFPSQGAGGGTEALRAIGSGAGQVVGGTDARLTDTRTPTDGTVTPAKMAFANTFNFSAAGGLQAQGMRVHRHPYGSDRHIESGRLTGTESGGGFSGSVSFTDAYAAGPQVIIGAAGNYANWVLSSSSTTGFTWGGSGPIGTHDAHWIAEGQD